jgi:hypothetical protein
VGTPDGSKRTLEACENLKREGPDLVGRQHLGPPITVASSDLDPAARREGQHIGTKGIGEIGIVGVAAAIANAVYHATGKRITSLPITIEQLML